MRHYEEALAACDRALALKPNAGWGPHSFGSMALLATGRLDEAIAADDRPIGIEPNDGRTNTTGYRRQNGFSRRGE